jgi:hypothetical protein
VIVAEFFDSGQSRAVPWQRRPQAAALLSELKNPDRGFDAVVIGEPQRAFYGNQFGLVFPLFVHYGVALWVPEVGGPIDPDNEAHDLIMSVFGGMSKGERNRIKVRVRAAMAAQAQVEGRFLGGRPPYGYQMVDLGPHPNPAKAADGRRLHGLAIDDEAAAVVQRIFEEFIAGRGLFAIAEGLTGDGVACPSAHDPSRNTHRCGLAWSKSAIRAILTNPRYTGRQVWNKQRKDEVLLDVDDVALGHATKLRWNAAEQWIISEQVTHAPIVDTDTFDRAQRLLAARGRRRGDQKTPRSRRPYVLRGALVCGVCNRKMQGHWSREAAYYRCRFPAEYALANRIDHPRNVDLREQSVLDPLDAWLAQVLAPAQLAETIETMAAAQDDLDRHGLAANRAIQKIAECETKLTRHRAALEAGADPALVTGWIAETQAERIKAESELRQETGGNQARMTTEEIAALVDSLGNLLTVLHEADPADKAEVYRQLGLRLTYEPDTQTVRAEAQLGPRYRGVMVRVRGRTRTIFPYGPILNLDVVLA